MELIKIDNMDDLEYCNKTLKTLFTKTTDIFETDISWSFRVFTDDGKRTILFYEFKKFVYTSEMKKADKEAKKFYDIHLKK